MTRSSTSESNLRPARVGRGLSQSAELIRRGLLVVVGLAAGSSVFVGFGLYELSIWGPVALLFVVIAIALWIANPSLPRGPGLVCVAALLLLGAWSYLSSAWAESADQAVIDGARWLLYSTALFALLGLLRGARAERLLMAAVCAPVLALMIYLYARMAIGDGSGLFLANRLNAPLEYVNGMAGYLLICFWPMVALAERARSIPLAGAGLTAATSLAILIVMTQSRGSIAALALSAAVLVALVPGRVRRGWALVLVVAGVVACVPVLDDVLRALPPGETADADAIAAAARSGLIAATAAGALWMLALTAGRRLAAREHVELARLSGGALVAVAVIGLLAVSLPVSQRKDQIEEQYEAFTQLRAPEGGTRLSAGGGNRYDYWRIALDQFEEAPVRGVGSGNYDITYFRDRRTTEDVRNPHSIELQVLGETGVVGGLLLAVFAGGAMFGLWTTSRPGASTFEPGLAVAAGGAFLVWLGQTSVDWLHLIPGLTLMALCALACLVVPRRAPAPRDDRAGVAPVLGGVLIASTVAVAVAIPFLADRLVSSGREDLETDPAIAAEQARDALALNDESLPAYYLEAAALARLGAYQDSRAALLEATRREPSDYVTWALLGDLATRRGDPVAAQGYYAKAAALNPRDDELAALAGSRERARQQRIEPTAPPPPPEQGPPDV